MSSALLAALPSTNFKHVQTMTLEFWSLQLQERERGRTSPPAPSVRTPLAISTTVPRSPDQAMPVTLVKGFHCCGLSPHYHERHQQAPELGAPRVTKYRNGPRIRFCAVFNWVQIGLGLRAAFCPWVLRRGWLSS